MPENRAASETVKNQSNQLETEKKTLNQPV
jgi:hypothetical protein